MQRFGFEPGIQNLAASHSIDISDGAGIVSIPGDNFLLSASFDRLGPDLLLSFAGEAVLLKDYFRQESPPELLSSDGSSVINGSLANRLAGSPTPGQFAQLSGAASVDAINNNIIGIIYKIR